MIIYSPIDSTFSDTDRMQEWESNSTEEEATTFR